MRFFTIFVSFALFLLQLYALKFIEADLEKRCVPLEKTTWEHIISFFGWETPIRFSCGYADLYLKIILNSLHINFGVAYLLTAAVFTDLCLQSIWRHLQVVCFDPLWSMLVQLRSIKCALVSEVQSFLYMVDDYLMTDDDIPTRMMRKIRPRFPNDSFLETIDEEEEYEDEELLEEGINKYNDVKPQLAEMGQKGDGDGFNCFS